MTDLAGLLPSLIPTTMSSLFAKGIFDFIGGMVTKQVGMDAMKPDRDQVARIISIVCLCLMGLSFLFMNSGELNSDKLPMNTDDVAKYLGTTKGFNMAQALVGVLLLASSAQSMARFKNRTSYHYATMVMACLGIFGSLALLARGVPKLPETAGVKAGNGTSHPLLRGGSVLFASSLLNTALLLGAVICNDQLSYIYQPPPTTKKGP